MEIVKLIILSHKRADRVDTLKAFDNCTLCVEESQVEEYKKYNPNVEYLVHPDNVVGLAAKIRWVYERYPNCFMLDDDLQLVRNYIDPTFKMPTKVPPNVAYEIVQSLAYTAKQLGVKMFGFCNSPKPVTYTSCDPFKLTGFVQGGATGFFEGFKMILPNEATSCIDYFLSGVNAHFHRKTLIDKRFAVVSKDGTFKSSGGMSDFRNMASEREDYLLLRQYFGDAIQRKNASPVKKLSHEFEKTLKIPF